MSVLAKITAVLLILLGLLVIVGGIIAAGSGALRAFQPGGTGPGGMPFFNQAMQGWLAAAVGIGIIFQGLILTAVGEGLFLIAQVAEQTAASNRILARRPFE